MFIIDSTSQIISGDLEKTPAMMRAMAAFCIYHMTPNQGPQLAHHRTDDCRIPREYRQFSLYPCHIVYRNVN